MNKEQTEFEDSETYRPQILKRFCKKMFINFDKFIKSKEEFQEMWINNNFKEYMDSVEEIRIENADEVLVHD